MEEENNCCVQPPVVEVQKCLTITQVQEALNNSESFVHTYGARIKYSTLVSWLNEHPEVFPHAHKLGKMWGIPETDLTGIETRLPPRGNPDWAAGRPRRMKTTYRWGYVLEDLAKRLYDEMPYVANSGQTPRKYALSVVRNAINNGKLIGLPFEFDPNPARYQRIQLVREITALAEKTA